MTTWFSVGVWTSNSSRLSELSASFCRFVVFEENIFLNMFVIVSVVATVDDFVVVVVGVIVVDDDVRNCELLLLLLL